MAYPLMHPHLNDPITASVHLPEPVSQQSWGGGGTLSPSHSEVSSLLCIGEMDGATQVRLLQSVLGLGDLGLWDHPGSDL